MDPMPDPFAPLHEAPPPSPSIRRAAAPAVIMPAPLPLPDVIQHPQHGPPAMVWRYFGASGALLFAVARFNLPGGKQVLPYCCTATGWRWKAADALRPLYGLDRLAARPDAPVLLVEGEKTADAAALLFPDHVAMTWPGGSNATGKADWAPLAGRHVAVWPDNDAPGRKAAAAAGKAASAAGAAAVAVVVVPTNWPECWDVADPLPEGVAPDALVARLAEAEASAADSNTTGNSDRTAEIVRLAGLADMDLALERREVAQRLGLTVADLAAAVKAARRDIRRAQREAAEGDASRAGTGRLDPDTRGRTDLVISAADLPDTARDLGALLAEVPHLFDRGGPARIAFDAQRGGMMAEPLTLNAVVNEAHAVARPWRYRRERDGTLSPEAMTLPERVAHLYLAMRGKWGLRPLDGIAASPLLAEDGSLRVVDGYDAGTRMWCERIPTIEVPKAPSKADAAAALLRLRLFLSTFAFAGAVRIMPPGGTVAVVDTSKPPGADESAALVALLTAVCRPSLRLTPALVVHAPSYSGAGTGKGLLVRVLCAIAYGLAPRAMTAGGNPEELDKRLVAALIGAEQVVFLDNVNGTALRSDMLASAITERPAYVRALGRSATMPLNPTAFIAVTGNGLVLSEDLARRFLAVELDAGMEDPEARDFKGDLLRDAMERRADLLRDVLTIWRWGRLAAAEIAPGRPLGSFHDWGRWCRDPLLALGCADPAKRVADAKANDPRRRQIAELFAAWWQRHHDLPVTVAALHEDVRLVADPAGKGRQYLAAAVAKLEGTRANGFVLTRTRSSGKWSPDSYALKRADAAPTPENHRDHRGHREGGAQAAAILPASAEEGAPYACPMLDAGPDHRGEHSGPEAGGMPRVDAVAPYDPHACAGSTAGGGVEWDATL